MRRHLEEGREAYERRSWRTAHEALARARAEGPLEPDDLWRFALSSYLIGSEDDFLSALREAHQAHVDAGDLEAGARRCFWIGMHLANRADAAQASGWFQRAARLVQEAGRDCAERGYLLLPTGQRALGSHDPEAALRAGVEATRIARRFQDTDLLALALHLQGRALLRLGRVDEGLGLLDEAMVAVTADEPSPPVTGIVYCSVIAACREVWAVGRAHEWTDALSTWCERQPDMVPYTGECRVYRSEVLRLRGAWQDALDEARGATRRFAEGSIPDATGMALYQQAEVYRLRGEFAAAEEAYRAASRAGRAPDPGLALLR
ncbi:MAG TPA: hypothetical protein VK849_00385, partial [Longimicrobiales bacterium]|nr:hypothetical protein [Longimicrobiales bacterium]